MSLVNFSFFIFGTYPLHSGINVAFDLITWIMLLIVGVFASLQLSYVNSFFYYKDMLGPGWAGLTMIYLCMYVLQILLFSFPEKFPSWDIIYWWKAEDELVKDFTFRSVRASLQTVPYEADGG